MPQKTNNSIILSTALKKYYQIMLTVALIDAVILIALMAATYWLVYATSSPNLVVVISLLVLDFVGITILATILFAFFFLARFQKKATHDKNSPK